MDTTYIVYIVICNVIKKGYIGITRQPHERKRGHFWALRIGHHPSKLLQECYNKYGKDSFSFEVLESGISESDKYNREHFWTTYFNSVEDGFNKYYSSNSNTQMLTWNGVTYRTFNEAAQANGISDSAMIRRVRLGYTCDADMKQPNWKLNRRSKEKS